MAQFELLGTSTFEPTRPPSTARVTYLIARRAALEALRDRLTLIMSIFFALVFPFFLVVGTVLPLTNRELTPDHRAALVQVLAIYLLIIGLMPSTASVGIAAGQFAGEKEQGNLTPILASPASNLAIFAGKVLGSIVPATLFAVVAELTYLASVATLTGSHTLRLLSPGLAIAMLALVPATALFAAIIASLISSRVRTFNTAQQISGLALVPLWGVVIGLGYKLQDWGGFAVAVLVVGLFVVDLVLTLVAANTWRREEVLSKQ
jgi:ABC-type transport system involved in multi-copper enzyme maturation permease subunit